MNKTQKMNAAKGYYSNNTFNDDFVKLVKSTRTVWAFEDYCPWLAKGEQYEVYEVYVKNDGFCCTITFTETDRDDAHVYDQTKTVKVVNKVKAHSIVEHYLSKGFAKA